ncbi:hypothetical protein MYX06_04300 [Patescibacteria group bacterium AH-259-L05]|nr:hypothetical protein [Patescibacteria group bacterium AH-259-L05]
MNKNNSKIPTAVNDAIERMLKRSQTKILFPVITLGIVKAFLKTNQDIFTDLEIRGIYQKTVQELKKYLGHDLHIGGIYYDAYSSRNLPQHKVIKIVGHKKYQLNPLYKNCAKEFSAWLPRRIKTFIDEKLGIVTKLAHQKTRIKISSNSNKFVEIIKNQIDKNASNFEIFGFTLIKVHLEKFACKVYRDTRTSSHDAGVDLSTNFGVVYQIKKLRVTNMGMAKNIYAELKSNFDKERLDDGKVILIIDDITREIKKYLIDMKVQSIDKKDLLNLAQQFQDNEDREKILRIIYEEFRREYASVI